MKEFVKDLKNNKSVTGDIPTNFLKVCKFTFSVLFDCINKSFETGKFPFCFKEANVTLTFRNGYILDKETYIPGSMLPLLSKVYRKLIYKHLSSYIDRFVSSIICDYRRAHNTQHYFLSYSFLAKRDRSKMIGAYNSNLFIKGIWLQNS